MCFANLGFTGNFKVHVATVKTDYYGADVIRKCALPVLHADDCTEIPRARKKCS